MSLINFFRGLFSLTKTPPLHAGAEGVPLELIPAIEALKSGQATEALKAAQPYLKSRKENVKADALRVSALACSRLGQWDEAHQHFTHLLSTELSVHNLLQVSTTALMRGTLDEAAQTFDLAIKLNQVRQEIPQGRMHTAFLDAVSQSGHYAEGLPHLEWLRRAFQSISRMDDQLLYMHGLPFFSVFLEKSFSILQACLPAAEIQAWYQLMYTDLDEESRRQIEARLASLPG